MLELNTFKLYPRYPWDECRLHICLNTLTDIFSLSSEHGEILTFEDEDVKASIEEESDTAPGTRLQESAMRRARSADQRGEGSNRLQNQAVVLPMMSGSAAADFGAISTEEWDSTESDNEA
ncbi:unnamed protein product [Protopolystoma xenopodis]|uniref:Uncharacterized protein n=1 Tax=Protopolystoma xenopodis TaxID=117903 RepID=A0A3S5BX91_9PLAT|nr:unnamed protein product [Protopolystoma xenopodis]